MGQCHPKGDDGIRVGSWELGSRDAGTPDLPSQRKLILVFPVRTLGLLAVLTVGVASV